MVFIWSDRNLGLSRIKIVITKLKSILKMNQTFQNPQASPDRSNKKFTEVFGVDRDKGHSKTIHNNESLIEKSFKLSHFQEDNIENIKTKAAELCLYYEMIDDEIQVVGEQLFVLEFLTWLYEFLNKSLTIQKEDFSQEEVGISTFHRLQKEDILNKAQSLTLI